MNIHAVIGDEILVDSLQLGHPPRSGEVLEVIGEGDVQHYLVRWDDGHVSTFYPAAASRVVHYGQHH